MSVCEVEKLEGYAFLVRGAANMVEEQVNEAGIAGAFGEPAILEGCQGDSGICNDCWSWL